jgi:hypothetical protein
MVNAQRFNMVSELPAGGRHHRHAARPLLHLRVEAAKVSAEKNVKRADVAAASKLRVVY